MIVAGGMDIVAAVPLLALAIYLKWLGIFYFMQGFQTSGIFIRTIIQIISDTYIFMLVLAITVLGTSFCLYVLVSPDDTQGTYDTPGSALLSTFNLLLVR